MKLIVWQHILWHADDIGLFFYIQGGAWKNEK